MRKILDVIRHRLGSVFHGNREAGMATAEYAVGTVAVVTLGSVLYKILSDPTFRDLIWEIIKWILKLIMGIGG
jgi:hypothetical protein